MRNTVKQLRAERGWTQEDLGRQVGVSRQAINAIETEKHEPSLSLAFKIAALFDLGVEDIFHNPDRRG